MLTIYPESLTTCVRRGQSNLSMHALFDLHWLQKLRTATAYDVCSPLSWSITRGFFWSHNQRRKKLFYEKFGTPYMMKFLYGRSIVAHLAYLESLFIKESLQLVSQCRLIWWDEEDERWMKVEEEIRVHQ